MWHYLFLVLFTTQETGTLEDSVDGKKCPEHLHYFQGLSWSIPRGYLPIHKYLPEAHLPSRDNVRLASFA
jgi:hypothetical protein